MKPEVLFFICLFSFAIAWGLVAILYFARVVPTIRKYRGTRTFLEAGLQMNFTGHIREYGDIARQQNSPPMLRVYYVLNGMIIIAILIFVIGIASTFLPEVTH